MFGDGWGPTDPATEVSQLVAAPTALAAMPTIAVGGVDANVAFAGLTGSGLYQFNVEIPDVPDGDAEVRGSLGGVNNITPAFVAVQR